MNMKKFSLFAVAAFALLSCNQQVEEIRLGTYWNRWSSLVG